MSEANYENWASKARLYADKLGLDYITDNDGSLIFGDHRLILVDGLMQFQSIDSGGGTHYNWCYSLSEILIDVFRAVNYDRYEDTSRAIYELLRNRDI
jgi:hypothetical protein